MASARQHGSDDQGDRARTCRRRRSHLQLGTEKTLSEALGRARPGRNAVLLHHAGADCGDRAVHTDRRLYRQGTAADTEQRVDPRRPGGVRAGRAILTAMNQEDYMRAVVGDDALWNPLPGFFTPGTPLYSEDGGEILKGPRRLDAAKRLLADSGYSGQPVTCVVAQDLQIT